jgi:AcrR family transcriptional regulator
LHEGVPVIPPSTKQQIVRAAERLLSERGLGGVSLREIGAAAGNGNNSAVQYHFGSKDQLVQAIFEYRLPHLDERRKLLIAERRPHDLRSWVECYVLPILEQGEQEGSHYLSFVAMLQQHGHRRVFDRIPDEFRALTDAFREQVAARLPHIPEPLRTHRIAQAMAFSVHAAADRERAQAHGYNVLPFAVHVTDVLDGLVGFLEAPVSPQARSALEDFDPGTLAWPLVV